MKQIIKYLSLILLIVVISCSNNNIEYSCVKNTIRILNKTKKEAVFIAVSDFAKLYNEKKI